MKKVLAMLLSLTLVVTLTIGGSIAYLQDTDSDVNVMTLGNVKITQNEQQRVESVDDKGNQVFDNTLEPFKPGKIMLPYVDKVDSDNTVTLGKDANGNDRTITLTHRYNNYVDKIVTVTNDSTIPVYARTIVALPTGGAAWDGTQPSADNWLHWNYDGDAVSSYVDNYPLAVAADGPADDPVQFTVDGITYEAYVFVYKDEIAPGETTMPSIVGLFMDCRVDDNDDGTYTIYYANGTTKLIDNFKDANGDVSVMVLSQAVQAAGFEDAVTALNAGFGVANKDNVENWFGKVEASSTVVSNAEELIAALAAGGNVVLTDDVELAENANISVPAGKIATLNLNGNTLTVKNTEAKASSAIDNKGTLTVSNGTVTYEGIGDANFGYGTNTITNAGTLVIDGATIINTTNSGSSNAIDNAPGAKLIVNSGTIKAEKIAIRIRDTADVTINGGDITGAYAVQIYLFQNVAGATNLTINGGTFTGTHNTSPMSLTSRAYGTVSAENTTVTIAGGIFNNDVTFGAGNKIGQEKVIVTGGTFHGYLGRYLENDGWEDIAQP